MMRIDLSAAIGLILLATGCSKTVTTYIPDVQYDYSGEWTLKWVDSDSRHPVSLAQKENTLSGIYTNAEDIACSVTGIHARDLEVELVIDCPQWDISMNGISTQKGTVISGKYAGEGKAGTFVMLKNKPAPTAETKAKKS